MKKRKSVAGTAVPPAPKYTAALDFPKACKVDLAVSRYKFRPAIENPYCDGERITATDGHILAIVPIKLEKKFTGPIPCELFRRGQKNRDKKKDMSIVVTDDTFKLGDDRVLFERDKSDFRYPDINNTIERAQKAEPAVTFYINPKLLMNLAKSIGSTDCVKVTVPKPNSTTGDIDDPLTVHPASLDNPPPAGTLGVIMSMRRP